MPDVEIGTKLNKYSSKFPYSSYSTHKLLAKCIGKERVVLDVGCNEGIIGKLADKSNLFYGLDINELALEEAKKYYEDVQVLDLNKTLKLQWDHIFDVIVFADILEHLYNPKELFFYFVTNYLKTSGKIIISLPNIANWKIRLNLLLGRFEYTETGIMDKTHLHFFTFNSAQTFFGSDNIKIIKILGGSRIFGKVIEIFPFTKGLLAHNIILVLEKDN